MDIFFFFHIFFSFVLKDDAFPVVHAEAAGYLHLDLIPENLIPEDLHEDLQADVQVG